MNTVLFGAIRLTIFVVEKMAYLEEMSVDFCLIRALLLKQFNAYDLCFNP